LNPNFVQVVDAYLHLVAAEERQGTAVVYFDDGRSMYVAPVFFVQVDTTVKVLESRFFTQYKSKGFGGISNWIQEVI